MNGKPRPRSPKRRKEPHTHEEFLRQKVEAGRAVMVVGHGVPDEAVEAEFEARRDALRRELSTGAAQAEAREFVPADVEGLLREARDRRG